MNQKTIKICRYAAGAVFAFSPVYALISNSHITFWTVVSWAALVLMALSMFTGKFSFLAVGSAMSAVSTFVRILNTLLGGSGFSFWLLLSNLLTMLAYIFLFSAALQRRSAFKYSVLSAALIVIASICAVFSYHIALADVLSVVLNRTIQSALPFVLSGVAMQFSPQKQSVKKAAVSNAAALSTIEQLSRLKELLDLGAITQDEFDARKNRLLGQ